MGLYGTGKQKFYFPAIITKVNKDDAGHRRSYELKFLDGDLLSAVLPSATIPFIEVGAIVKAKWRGASSVDTSWWTAEVTTAIKTKSWTGAESAAIAKGEAVLPTITCDVKYLEDGIVLKNIMVKTRIKIPLTSVKNGALEKAPKKRKRGGRRG